MKFGINLPCGKPFDAVAALNCTDIGTRGGLPTLEQVKNLQNNLLF